jgi:endonuclease YncB( thermonuclease family)
MSSSHRRRWNRQSRRGLWRRLCDYGLTVGLLGLLALLAAKLDRHDMQTQRGTAVVNDGDSITLGKERVRLLGIDAPEYSQVCQRGGADYACGRRAREALVQLIGRRPVSCSGTRRDRYGRFLGECIVGDVNLNRAQVVAGWAVAYGGYETEEAAARAAKAGIWAGTFDRPQDWRRHHGAAAEPKHDDLLARIGDWLRQALRFWR